MLKRTVSLRRFFWVPTTQLCFGREIFDYATIEQISQNLLRKWIKFNTEKIMDVSHTQFIEESELPPLFQWTLWRKVDVSPFTLNYLNIWKHLLFKIILCVCLLEFSIYFGIFGVSAPVSESEVWHVKEDFSAFPFIILWPDSFESFASNSSLM